MKRCGNKSHLSVLEDSEFYKDKTKPSGLSSWCKVCSINRTKQQKIDDPDCGRRNGYKRMYGISLEQYDQLLKDQNYVCKICENPCKSGMRLAVDHCHVTGTVRGLLCAKCNRALGGLNHDIDLINKAITYLKTFQ